MVWLYEEGTHAPIGVLERYYVLRAVRRYDAHGEIEIQAPASALVGVVKPGTVVWMGRGHQAYIIDNVDIAPEDTRGDVVTLTGFSVTRLLNRRVIAESRVYTATAGAIISTLASGILSQPKRGFDMLDTSWPAIGPEMTYESEPMELDEAALALCKAGGIGIRGAFSGSARRLSIELYAGQDRTVSSATPVILSPAYENITNMSYSDSTNAYKNIVYVLGDKPKEGPQIPALQVVGQDLSGYARYEAVAQSGKSRHVSIDGGGSYEMTTEQYNGVLRQYGDEYLAKTVRSTTCDGEIVAGSRLYKVGQDYDLGDVVTVRHPRYRIEENLRVQEIEESYENGDHAVHVQLGDPKPTLLEKIKLKK